MSDAQLATRKVVVPLLRRIYALIDDVGQGKVAVADELYARNALHLLRDALLDAKGVAALLTAAVARRLQLEEQQIAAMILA